MQSQYRVVHWYFLSSLLGPCARACAPWRYTPSWEVSGGRQTWCFTPAALSGRVGLIERHRGLKPDWGELNVRNFRGGAGNVSDGRTRTPPHNRMSEGRKLPPYGCARLCSTRPS